MNTASKKEDAHIVNGVELEKGKIYLRDKRNGTVHQYQELLAQMQYFEKFEYTGELPKHENRVSMSGTSLSAQDRAKEWDRRAMLKNEEREAEDAAKAEYSAEQAALTQKADSGNLDAYKDDEIELLDRSGFTLADYRAKEWTNDALVEQGLAKKL